MNNKVVSFPHLSNYDVPIKYLIEKLTNAEVIPSPSITKKTIELGSKYSPDYVCMPFKYTLGNYIESLDNGANILIQAGGGCRFGYYFELQKKILEDLGYKFEFYSLSDNDVNGIGSMYNMLRKINPNLKKIKYLYYLVLTFLMINYMDKIDMYIRKNIGFEIKKGSFERIKKGMLNSFYKSNNIFTLIKNYYKYKRKFKNIKLDKIISEGKESICYDYGDKVVKIFKEKRTSPFKRISDEGLIKLSTLDLKHFNKPIDIIYDNEKITGYTENKLVISDKNQDIDENVLLEIKKDIITLSYSGFKIEDIFYNYTTSDNFKFYDLTSFDYIKSTKKELYDMYYKKNIMTINTFLVGFLMYDAYRHDSKYEIKKTYKATEFINENLGNEYYGDYLKNRYKKM